MALKTYKYQTSAATTGSQITCGIVLDDKRKAAAGQEAGGTLPANFFIVEVGKNRHGAGIKPRGFNCKAAGGKRTFIPAFTESYWNGKKVGDKLTIGGVQYEISSKVPEKGYTG